MTLLDRQSSIARDITSVALECKELAKNFGGVPAVSGLNLSIAKGEILALLGPSGCGKTTALRLIAGFENPDQGVIVIGGQTVSENSDTTPPERRRVCLLYTSDAADE